MRLAPFACSACGSRYWPDPDSSCELCQPSCDDDEQDPDDALDYWEEMRDRRTDWTAEPEEEEPELTEKQ